MRAEHHSGRDRRQHREGDRRQVEDHLIQPRNRDAIADQSEQAPVTERGNAKSRDAAGRREHQALGKHLAHQPPAACAKRRAHAEFAFARDAARQ
jgi:hypothetical protein